jgi:uncharacterized protein involved in exopolysaccharide biosynthesis
MEQTEVSIKDTLRSLKKTFNYLLSKWYLFLIIGALGGAAGIAYATFEKAKYESRLTFSLEESGGGLSGALSLAAEFGINIGGSGTDIFAGDNIMTILTSRRIIEEVFLSADTIDGKAATLADWFMIYNKLDYSKKEKIGKISFPINIDRVNFSYHQDSILFTFYENAIKKNLRVQRPDKRLNYYEITYVSPNERFSKVFTEKLIDAATKFYIELKSKRSRETLDILTERAQSMRGGVRSAIQKQASIKDANINPAFSGTNATVQQQQVDATAYGKAYEELFKTLELARYQYLKNIPLLQIIDAPKYPMKKIKNGRMKSGIIGGILSGIFLLLLLSVIRVWKSLD